MLPKREKKVVQQKKLKKTDPLPEVVSLFSGAGGLDWGFHKAGFKVSLAIDISDAAIRTHRKNFKTTSSIVADLIKLKPEGVAKVATEAIRSATRIGVIGGPPCQGFSRANVFAQKNDPRNKLPKLYLDIVKKLQEEYVVDFVVFENVLGIRDKKHKKTFSSLVDGLSELGFTITVKELCALDFGVPQNRRRVIISALRADSNYGEVVPLKKAGFKTVREAIGLLPEPKFFEKKLTPADIPHHPNHWTMQPKSPRFLNPEKSHGDGRSFKRLIWDKPSPTIAFGNREIHVHPEGRRRLSIYEAMLLQGFPRNFILEGNLSEQVEQVSNAVPPPLALSIASAVKSAILKRI